MGQSSRKTILHGFVAYMSRFTRLSYLVVLPVFGQGLLAAGHQLDYHCYFRDLRQSLLGFVNSRLLLIPEKQNISKRTLLIYWLHSVTE